MKRSALTYAVSRALPLTDVSDGPISGVSGLRPQSGLQTVSSVQYSLPLKTTKPYLLPQKIYPR